ncbi:MAG: hypothetical protein HYZ90_04775 [Candidatus Omnitrophica bacterium]|nr:hypothetical protein [Candidatus Omnitrophota bacterium]
MPKAAFTVLELLISVVVIAVIASVAVLGYEEYKDRTVMLIEGANEKRIAVLLKIHTTDTGTVAGSLSEIPREHFERATALQTEGKRPYTVWAHLQQKWREFREGSVAFAQLNDFLPSELYQRDLSVITCPRDKTPPTGFDASGRPIPSASYEIAPEAAGQPLSWLLDPANAGARLIIEADDGGLEEYRHLWSSAAVEVSVGGDDQVVRIPRGISARIGKISDTVARLQGRLQELHAQGNERGAEALRNRLEHAEERLEALQEGKKKGRGHGSD